MSAKELRNFEDQLELLSFTEQLTLLEFLVKLLQRKQTVNVVDNSKYEVEKINAVLDKIPLSEQTEYCDVGLETVREALKNDTW